MLTSTYTKQLSLNLKPGSQPNEREKTKFSDGTKEENKKWNGTNKNERMWMKHREMNNDEIALWIL